jgi:competence protein ComEA
MARLSFTAVTLITVSILVGAGMRAVAAGSSQAAAAAQESETVAAERATQEAVCGTCHEPNLVEGTFRMPEEWDDTLRSMKSFGAQGTEEQFNRIRSFLLRKYGKAKINTATATDLAPILDVPPTVAEAVVAHRRDNGPFKSLDDLKKVPGLDAAQVDARKARLMF